MREQNTGTSDYEHIYDEGNDNNQTQGEHVMADDNWSHRSFGMKCRSCMWYVPKGNTKLGRCRHNAPTLDGWPAVYESDWCGQHKLNEDVVGRTATPVSIEAA